MGRSFRARQGLSVNRRQFVQGMGSVGLGLVAGCDFRLFQQPQPTRVYRVGYLRAPPTTRTDEVFSQALHDLGYVEGQNIVVERRASMDGLGDPAAELVRLQVDVIVASGPTILSAMEATSTIPIVMMAAADPVGSGYVASLAQPGGNVTGLSLLSPLLSAKRLELLKHAVPAASRFAVLWSGQPGGLVLAWRETQVAAQALGVEIESLEVSQASALDSAFETAARERVDGLILLPERLLGEYRERLLDLAMRNRLPTMYSGKAWAAAGGLMAYGPNTAPMWRRAAYYVDRILKGARPADLPVEQPTNFDFVINLKTAQALGLTIPQHVLAQATELIQ
jgi:putative tryptophan/tyrosine transport system substrate-binding protein